MGKIGVGIGPTFISVKPGPPPTVYATLDPNPAKLKDVTLSDGNLTARITDYAGYATKLGSARSSIGKTSGKFYLEVWRIFDNYTGGLIQFGLNSLTPTQASNGSGVVMGTSPRLGATYPSRLAVDIDAGKIWLSDISYTDGRWNTGADPETGASPGWTFTPGGQEYVPFIRPFRGTDSYGTVEAWMTINFGATPFVYSVPAGYTTWSQ